MFYNIKFKGRRVDSANYIPVNDRQFQAEAATPEEAIESARKYWEIHGAIEFIGMFTEECKPKYWKAEEFFEAYRNWVKHIAGKRSVGTVATAEAYHPNYFSKETMRFFKSHTCSGILKRNFFISSEIDPSGKKAWTVRFVTAKEIGALGAFHRYSSEIIARKALDEFHELKKIVNKRAYGD